MSDTSGDDLYDKFLAAPGAESGSDYSNDDDEDDNEDDNEEASTRFARIQDRTKRMKQASQYRKRAEKVLAKIFLRTGLHSALVCVNEVRNTNYFSTTGQYFKMTLLIAALERAKRDATDAKKSQSEVSLADVLKRFRGTPEKKGENFMVKVSQCFAELGINEDVLDKVYQKYQDAMVQDADFDVAAVLKQRLVSVLDTIANNGFLPQPSSSNSSGSSSSSSSSNSSSSSSNEDSSSDSSSKKRKKKKKKKKKNKRRRTE